MPATVRLAPPPDQPPADAIRTLYELPLSERAVTAAGFQGSLDGLEAIDVDRDLTDRRLRAVARLLLALSAEGGPVTVSAVLARLLDDPDVRWQRQADLDLWLAELTSVEACPLPASSSWDARELRRATARRRLADLARCALHLASGELDSMAVTKMLVAEVQAVAADLKRVNP